MIIEVEYPITTTGKPARSNKTKTVVFKETVRFDLPEYSSSEARVAISVPGPQGFLPTDYLGIDGKLYYDTVNKVPRSRQYEFVLGLRKSADILTAHLEESLLELGKHLRRRNSTAIASELYPSVLAEHFARGLGHSGASNNRPETEVRLPSIDEIEVKDLDMAEVDRQKHAFLAHLSEFAVVNGSLIRTIPEPVYSVSVGYADSNTGTPTEGTPPVIHIVKPDREGRLYAKNNTNVVAYFSADRLDDAIAYAIEMKAAQTDKQFEVKIPGEIRVLDHSYLTFDAERESLLVMAEHMIVDGMTRIFNRRNDNISMSAVRQGLDRVAADTLLSWKRLSGAMEHPNHEELGWAIRECLGHYDHYGQKVFVDFPLTAEMYEAALSKWENREVSVNIGVAPSPGGGMQIP